MVVLVVHQLKTEAVSFRNVVFRVGNVLVNVSDLHDVLNSLQITDYTLYDFGNKRNQNKSYP